jgi:hypothetical protein
LPTDGRAQLGDARVDLVPRLLPTNELVALVLVERQPVCLALHRHHCVLQVVREPL